MYLYTLRQWLLFFYTYCFFGWIFESCYVSLKQKCWTNRGFMYGPFLPIYGSGAILALFVTIPVRDNYVLMYIFGALAATVLEYVTGVVMEAVFKVRYWDYSYKKYHFQGHICLSSTIAWGFFVILLVKVIHRPIERMILALQGFGGGYLEEVISFGVTIIFAADLALSFKEAFELRELLIYLEKLKDEAKQEAEYIKERVDLKIASVDAQLHEKASEIKERTEEKVIEFKELAEGKVSEIKGHAGELKERMIQQNVRRIKRFLVVHPTAKSDQLKNALAEIRSYASNHKNHLG